MAEIGCFPTNGVWLISSSAWEHQSASWRQSSPARRLIPCSALEQCSSREECRCAAGIVPASAAHRRSHAAPRGNRGQVQGGALAPVTTRAARKQEEQLHGSANNTLYCRDHVARRGQGVTNKRRGGLCPVARIRGTVPSGMAGRITSIEMIGSGCQQISM